MQRYEGPYSPIIFEVISLVMKKIFKFIRRKVYEKR